jgi:hypothetical protein
MPLQLNENLPTGFPSPSYLTLSSQKRGVISLIDKSLLPKDALEQADNIFLYEQGQAGPRPGIDWFGTESPNGEEWDGMDYFDFEGVIHLVGVAGGTVYRSTNDGETWTACTGATLTAGIAVNMNQYNAFLYMTNGTDNITLYDGSTTLTQYSTLATPNAPTKAETGLTGTANSYYYKVARVNTVGFSAASAASTVVQADLDRANWDTTSNYVTLTTPNGVTGQTRWDIYISTDNSTYYYLASTTATDGAASTYVDNGSAIIVPSTTAPTESTAQGPLVAELTNVGSRMYGVRDTNNRYRIWFSSGNTPKGAFSTAYDGGYLDWQEGGKYIPVKVEDYRDGKGSPYATIWCDSADGQGCILQMSLDTLTVADVSVTIPSAYKLPGSRGTPSPGSVVNVLNDYMFYNSQAFYNLGSRAQFLNLLSTDEASANIRPTVKQISTAGESMIASVYYDAKVFFSVPYGASENNATAVFDTERKAWLPYAFTRGFKKFIRYTDTNGSQRLLALKPGDNRLSEISSSIQGDYGEAFTSVLMTGLYPTTRNRFEFQWTEEAEMEFSNPTGSIDIELIGIERGRGFRTQGTASVTAILGTTGWDTFLWDSTLWDDTSTAIDTYSESSVKRYFRLGRELNAVQWRITTSSIDAGYVLRTLQTWGTDTTAGKPRSWRLDLA